LPFRRFHLPLRRNCRSVANRIESYFCRSAVGGQPISVLVTSSLCIRKDVFSISVLSRNGNGSYGMEERQRYKGMAQQHSKKATEWWKSGINRSSPKTLSTDILTLTILHLHFNIVSSTHCFYISLYCCTFNSLYCATGHKCHKYISLQNQYTAMLHTSIGIDVGYWCH